MDAIDIEQSLKTEDINSFNLISLNDIMLRRDLINASREYKVEQYLLRNDLLKLETDGEERDRSLIVKRMDLTFNDQEC